jgi:hypothetical protein
LELNPDGTGRLEGKSLTWKLGSDGAVVMTNKDGLSSTIALFSTKERFWGTDFRGKEIYGIRKK